VRCRIRFRYGSPPRKRITLLYAESSPNGSCSQFAGGHSELETEFGNDIIGAQIMAYLLAFARGLHR
jgi:hypothetical protein